MKRIMVTFIMLIVMMNSIAQETGKSQPSIFTLNDLFTKQPFWTAELSGGFGYRLENYFLTYETNGGMDDNITLIGNNSLPYFFIIPKITTGYANLYFTTVLYYDVNKNSAIMPPVSTFGVGSLNLSSKSADKLLETGLTYKNNAFTYTNKLYIDFSNAHMGSQIFFIENSLTFSLQNITAHISSLNSWDGTFTTLSFNEFVITNAWLRINDLFSSITMLVGGTDFSYLRIRSLFASSSLKERILYYTNTEFFLSPFVTQQSGREFYHYYGMCGYFDLISVDGMQDVIAVSHTVPILSTISFEKSLKIPLTVTIYTPLPGNAVSLAEYFQGYSPTLAFTYEVPGIGTIDAGWVASIGYTIKHEQANDAGEWYTPVHHHDNNVFYLDAKLSLATLPELTILTGAELIPSTFYNMDPVSGTGAESAPYVRAILNSFEINYGFEVTYNMGKLIKGLSLGLGIYTNYGTGKTFQNMEDSTETFAQYNTTHFPDTGWVLLSSYTEENYIQFEYYEKNFPFSCFAVIDYELPRWKFSLQNLFIKLRGKIDGTSNWWNVTAAGAKRPMGFYDTDMLTIAATLNENSMSFTASISYTFFIGLPGINELGYTDAIAQGLGYHSATALYNDKAPDVVKYPWNLSLIYLLKY